MENPEQKNCPVACKVISSQDCKKVRAVFEETAPLKDLPVDIPFTDDNQIICLHCKYNFSGRCS